MKVSISDRDAACRVAECEPGNGHYECEAIAQAIANARAEERRECAKVALEKRCVCGCSINKYIAEAIEGRKSRT